MIALAEGQRAALAAPALVAVAAAAILDHLIGQGATWASEVHPAILREKCKCINTCLAIPVFGQQPTWTLRN
ncbi:MAG: hypothetical protein IPG65_15245 [Ottowia sp.]|nr:hypothetical protein [Ottowia sp.]MBK6747726.1 hypothetical protein [Ottowia sp.]